MCLPRWRAIARVKVSYPPPADVPKDPDEDGAPLDIASLTELHIQRVLRLVGGNKSAAAKILGVNRRTLLRKGF